jgi:hypothetical protein
MELIKLPTKKDQLNTYVNNAIGVVLSGEVDPLMVEFQLRIMEKAITQIRKDVRVKKYVMEEAEKYNGQKYMDCDIKVTERKTADYSGDTEWTILKAQLKSRETLLKGTGGIDPETGAIVVTYKVSEVLTIKL